MVGLQVPEMILDLWLDELAAGTMHLSTGLGVPASEIRPNQMRPECVKRFAAAPRAMAATPSFFGGSANEAKKTSLLGGTSQIHDSSTHTAQPHQSHESAHHLPSVLHTRVSKDAAEVDRTPKKQTNLSSFFLARPSASKSTPPRSAGSAAPPSAPASASGFAASSPGRSVHSSRFDPAATVIDLLSSSESETELRSSRRRLITPTVQQQEQQPTSRKRTRIVSEDEKEQEEEEEETEDETDQKDMEDLPILPILHLQPPNDTSGQQDGNDEEGDDDMPPLCY